MDISGKMVLTIYLEPSKISCLCSTGPGAPVKAFILQVKMARGVDSSKSLPFHVLLMDSELKHAEETYPHEMAALY